MLRRYQRLHKILLIFNSGISDGSLEDNHVYDALLDYMDVVWDNLSEEEKKFLTKNRFRV